MVLLLVFLTVLHLLTLAMLLIATLEKVSDGANEHPTRFTSSSAPLFLSILTLQREFKLLENERFKHSSGES